MCKLFFLMDSHRHLSDYIRFHLIQIIMFCIERNVKPLNSKIVFPSISGRISTNWIHLTWCNHMMSCMYNLLLIVSPISISGYCSIPTLPMIFRCKTNWDVMKLCMISLTADLHKKSDDDVKHFRLFII